MTMGSEQPGLGEYWPKVLNALRKVAPVYDKLNRVISFNSDMALRAEAVEGRIAEDELILDAGAGNGVFSEILLKQQPHVHDVVMLDMLVDMLSSAVEKVPREKTHAVIAVFEKMPFREKVFDDVLMGFSLRDARDMMATLSEVRRVIKPEGKMVVVDLGKPDNRLRTLAIGLYWRFVAPIMAFVRLGLVGLTVYSIYKTYERLPTNNEMRRLLRRFFKHVELHERVMGGALIVLSKDAADRGSGERAGR